MKLKCNAKINLCLAVKGIREDGYHLIDTVMQSVNIFDTLTINRADEISVFCSEKGLSGESNIAFTAASSFFKATKIDGGAEISIEKGIPEAAGLGGGSSDAAGVLLALNSIYSAGLDYSALCDIAASIGADVPFFIKGGTQRAQGIGEILEPLPPIGNLWFLIAKNGFKSSTKDMYRQLHTLKNPFNPDTESFINCLKYKDVVAAMSHIGNSFQPITGLFGIDKYLKDTNYNAICLSGSGPSVFAVYTNEAAVDAALNTLKSANITAFKALPIDKAIQIVE